MNVFIIAAISADGFIGPREHESSLNWTSGADKEFFKERTKEAGVIVMGRTTFETIGKALPGRRNIVYTKSEIAMEGIETTSLEPADLIQKLESEGHKEVAICGGSSIYSMFMESGLVDNIYLTVEPILFGDGIKLFNSENKTKLLLVKTTPLGRDALLLEYKVNK